jgi:ribosomal protein L14
MSELRELNQQNKFIFKLINNSLYGRMGMSAYDEKTVYTDEDGFNKIEREKDVIRYSKIGDAFIVTIKEEINERIKINSNVIYASIITSKARIKLHKGFMSVIENGGRLLYCDTDSIFGSYKKDVGNEKHGEIF